MFFKLKRKFALIPETPDLSLTAYVEGNPSLDRAFTRLNALGMVTQPAATLDYTLPAQSKSREVIRLPGGYHHLCVCSGCAWVTYHAQDYLLSNGAEMSFEHDSRDALVSCVGTEPLHFQVRS